jgi:LysR family transcriptional regulator, cyn operon transcriptional activator
MAGPPTKNDCFAFNVLMSSIEGAQIASKSHCGGKMELRHLRYFAALAEHLSFTRAAEKIHITQSTLSHQIKQFEEEVGLRLFDRIGKRVIMTEAGEILLGRVSKALQEIDDGVRAVRGVAGPLTGTIHIAATHTFNMSLIPTCIALFRGEYPAVCVEVRELSSSEIQCALGADEVELGIAYYPLNPQELFFEPLYIEDMVLVVSKGHPFASRKNIRLAELHRHELVLSSKESATRQMLDDRFKSAGAAPIVVAEMNSVSGMISLVRRTKIGAVVSQLATTETDDLCVVAIDNPKPLRTPGLLWKVTRPQPNIIKAFAAIVRHVVSEANMKPPK